MSLRHTAALLGAVATTAMGGWTAFAQSGANQTPTARYVMDAGTTSGMAAMAGAAAADPASAMAMMQGGGPRQVRELTLRLGSSQTPTGAPKADHFIPKGMYMGVSLPLATPTPAPVRPTPAIARASGTAGAKGRMLLFWGCGERAGPGQPVVIDFARPGGGAGARAPAGTMPVGGVPAAGNSRTYGDWPNNDPRQAKRAVRAGSLIGEHRIAGTYSPEIRFALQQDWMQPLALTDAPASGGATTLRWNAVGSATGYYAQTMGSAPNGDMVMWASSDVRDFGPGLTDWLPPATVAALIARKVVMPAGQTQCVMPAEVRKAAPGPLMTTLVAHGPEANFAYPPKPAGRVAWKPEWTAKVRFRSNTMKMLGGPDMAAAMRGTGPGGMPQATARRCPPVGGALRGVLGAVASAAGC